jgi:iron complex transport system substrate-binding protein
VRFTRRALLLGSLAVACRERAAPAPSPSSSADSKTPRRIVSLAPALTDSLFAIGAGPRVIGISDYCDYPPEAVKLPRLGTSLTPNYEAIARLSPDLVVSEANAGARRKELEALAPTLLLPWLSLDEVTQSLVELGRRVGTPDQANELSARMRKRLGVPEPQGGPRVLCVLGYEPGKLDEVWFVRSNSLHGAALRAAGGRNAVSEAVLGNPRLSLERVLELDPDVILILVAPHETRSPAAFVEDFQRFSSLRAIKGGRVRAVAAPEAFANGPRILQLADRLERELREAER